MIMKGLRERIKPGLKLTMLVLALLSATMTWAGDQTFNDPRTMAFPPVEFSPVVRDVEKPFRRDAVGQT